MLRRETEHSRFAELTKSLTLEERWELNRSRDVLLTGLFETTDVYTPTSFVVAALPTTPVSRTTTPARMSGDWRKDSDGYGSSKNSDRRSEAPSIETLPPWDTSGERS